MNALTPDDMLPEEEECPGITGVDRYNADGTPKQFKKQDIPQVSFLEISSLKKINLKKAKSMMAKSLIM